MAKVHDFNESLARSHQYEAAPWWRDVYKKGFPGLASMVTVRQDGWAQRGGIDRVLTLNSGRVVCVDEKVREEDWPDILLERWSDRDRKVPGWIQKSLACDYIAYAFAPSKRCYMLPFLDLRRAWRLNGEAWARVHRTVLAKNPSYVTESVAVPIPILMDALSSSMCISWGEAGVGQQAQVLPEEK